MNPCKFSPLLFATAVIGLAPFAHAAFADEVPPPADADKTQQTESRPGMIGNAVTLFSSSPAYVGVLGSYVDPAKRRHADYQGGGTLLTGLKLNEQIAAEVRLFGAVLDRRGDRNTPYIAGAGGDLRFINRSGLFLMTGAGFEYGSLDTSHRGSPYLEAGAGYERHILPRVSVRLESSYRLFANLGTNSGDHGTGGFDGEVWAGAGLLFDVRRSSRYDRVASAPVQVVEVQCPPPPAGFSVNSDGSPAPQDSRSVSIGFAFNSASLDDEARGVIAQLAASLRCGQAQRLVAQIVGHADRKGGDVYNVALSQKRAEAVRDELILQGIEPQRINIAGLGKYEPLERGSSPAIDAANRRIEIKLYPGETTN